MAETIPNAKVLPTLAFSFLNGCFIYVGASAPPNDADWQQYLAFIQHWKRPGLNPGIAVEQGGVPTTLQRKRLYDVISDMAGNVAVITNSTIGRGIVTVLSWISPGHKAFAPAKLPEALAYVGFQGREAREIEAEILRLKHGLLEVRPGVSART